MARGNGCTSGRRDKVCCAPDATGSTPGTNTTLLLLLCFNNMCTCRILRVVRVFSFNKAMRRHMEGAVTEAASMLGLTLLCILLIAAGLFYELEKYGVGCCLPNR